MILAVRQHGESSAIVEIFTPDRGRHVGLVRGGASRKSAPVLQPGAQVSVEWRARLEEHLGSFRIEPIKARTQIMNDRMALAAQTAICALCVFALPERMALQDLYNKTLHLIDQLDATGAWIKEYVLWEMALLEELGYGLDLSSCAVTGTDEELCYVSPKSGRAVSRSGAGEWADRLLPLPAFVISDAPVQTSDLLNGLRLTEVFLTRWMAPALGDRPLPDSRARLIRLIHKHLLVSQ